MRTGSPSFRPPRPGLEITRIGEPRAVWSDLRSSLGLEVLPGTHRLEVRTPAAPLPVEGRTHLPHTAAAQINLDAGEVARIDLAVKATAVPDPLRPVLRLWHCRIDRPGPAAAHEAPAAPKTDVRGGLRLRGHRAVLGD